MCCHPTVPGRISKRKVAADIRMHTVVLISAPPAALTHTGPASKSNQRRRETARIDYALLSVVLPPIFSSQTEGLRVYI